MADKKPIHSIAKDLGVDSYKVVKACNLIGIYAKGASKRLDIIEEEKIISYFKTGKNVANEVIDIKTKPIQDNQKELDTKTTPISSDRVYFPNRLIEEK
tara:strand:- start:4258 stop:4554 length:297 start_codon:yes stop_codon:yes gene_type:complete